MCALTVGRNTIDTDDASLTETEHLFPQERLAIVSSATPVAKKKCCPILSIYRPQPFAGAETSILGREQMPLYSREKDVCIQRYCGLGQRRHRRPPQLVMGTSQIILRIFLQNKQTKIHTQHTSSYSQELHQVYQRKAHAWQVRTQKHVARFLGIASTGEHSSRHRGCTKIRKK